MMMNFKKNQNNAVCSMDCKNCPNGASQPNPMDDSMFEKSIAMLHNWVMLEAIREDHPKERIVMVILPGAGGELLTEAGSRDIFEDVYDEMEADLVADGELLLHYDKSDVIETDRTRYLLGAAEVSEIDQNGNECSINLFTLERTIDYVNENLTVVSIGGELVPALRLISKEVPMKKFDVEITEALQRKVSVEAASQEDAERMVTQAWNNQDYVLDSGDFTDVDFKTVGEHELAETRTMDVLLVQPNAYPKKISVGTELEDLQAMVGGDIEVTYPFEDEVAIILNESGKINGLPLNRAIYTEDGDMQDIYAGDFLVVGLTEDDFGSLTSEQMQKFEEQFHQPQMFVRMGHSIMAIPVPDDMLKKMEEKAAKPQEKSKPAPDRDSL